MLLSCCLLDATCYLSVGASNYTSAAASNVSPCYPVGGFQVLYDEAAENAANNSDGGSQGVGAPYSSAGSGSSLDYLYASQRAGGTNTGGGDKDEGRGCVPRNELIIFLPHL